MTSVAHVGFFATSKRLLHTATRGTQSIRKENDLHTAEYYFENGAFFSSAAPYYIPIHSHVSIY